MVHSIIGHTNNSIVNISLHQFNDMYAIRILPVIVFLGCLMLLGLIGNSLVCYIYTVKFKSSTTRSFILSLALLDLVNCLINIPLEIFDMTHNYTYGTYDVCKLMPVLVTFSSLSSGAVLIIVAWERFRKICRPFKKQLTVLRAKILITVACVLALVLSTPAGVLYGPRTVQTDFSFMNGSECTIADEYVPTLYPILYLGFQFIMFVTVTLTLTVLYVLIWRRVLHQHRFRTMMSMKRGGNNSVLSAKEERTERCDGKTQTLRRCPAVSKTSFEDSPDAKEYSSETVGTSDSSRPTGSAGSEQTNQRTVLSAGTSCKPKSTETELGAHTKSTTSSRKPVKEVKKVTVMLFLITLAFVISFLPYLGLMVVMAVSDSEMGDMSTSSFVVFHLFLRSYFTQSAANPFIYGFCNAKFRMELKLLLWKSRCS